MLRTWRLIPYVYPAVARTASNERPRAARLIGNLNFHLCRSRVDLPVGWVGCSPAKSKKGTVPFGLEGCPLFDRRQEGLMRARLNEALPQSPIMQGCSRGFSVRLLVQF
jgi:hypothetical protein